VTAPVKRLRVDAYTPTPDSPSQVNVVFENDELIDLAVHLPDDQA
jgi:hypothetical protein